ncbi:MAG TPA: hypothetical protein VI112_01075 [Bacteroidia bacterium]|jgi:hypothetical protein
MNIPEQIKSLELHDAPVGKITFDPDHRTLPVEVHFYNEVKEDYDPKHLIFREANNITIGPLEEYDSLEISSCDITPVQKNFKAEFLFLCGIEKQSWEISFEFRNFKIESRS